MKINLDPKVESLPVPTFGDLKRGDCFTYPGCDILYMKVFPYYLSSGVTITCISLTDGQVFAHSDITEICPHHLAVVFANGDPR